MQLPPEWTAQVTGDDALWRDFEAICDCGGRLSGTDSERRAVELVARLAEDAAGGAPPIRQPVPYEGWTCVRSGLRQDDGTACDAYPLLRSVATGTGGLAAEVVDVGRGTQADFETRSGDLPGRIALVRHELMFAAETVHRSRKYQMARESGAAGFLIAGPLSGHVVAGSSGRAGTDGIPAMGISPETAARLGQSKAGFPRVTMTIETHEAPAVADNLTVELPGQTDEWVVLSAHIDGHEISESAMDNASGVAVALSALRCLAPHAGQFVRGLRVMFFNVEEWALTGSAHYVDGLSDPERDSISLNVNLDSVAGSPNLTALTSGYPGLGPFLSAVAGANDLDLRCHLPLMVNSDHANFARVGIPAFRLVAGFDEPGANLRHVLTPKDTRDMVSADELHRAALLTTAIAAAACNADAETAAAWRAGV